MNCNYRSIWNDTSGTFVAVSENTKSKGKTSVAGSHGGASGKRLALQTISICVALCFGVNAFAVPTGGVVAAGSASINTGGSNTTINQSSQNTVINWQSFNIAAGQSVVFVQPNSSSVALNRVLGSDPSSIYGSLSANGKVFLINPNGVLFGSGAQVNVGGLVASTLNISDRDFMSANYVLSGDGQGSILNQGSINADGGYVALLGAKVGNDGVISAQMGTVALAAGTAATLDVAGDGLLNVAVSHGAVDALAHNGGLIRADGGQVLLTAQGASSLLQSAVNNTGIIQAQTLQNRNGTIHLMGDMKSGIANVGGTLDVSAPNGGDGGFIETSAAQVNVAPNALVTAHSAQGKFGTWLIDPKDFTVAAGGDITGAALSASLDVANVTILSTAGTVGVDGDINVNEVVTWTAPTTLTMTALRDVNLAAAVTGTDGSLVADAVRDINVTAATTTTTGNFTLTAGNNINLAAATTITTGNLRAIAGQNVNVSAASTVTTGDMVLRSDNDGTGPGAAIGGTVAITCGNNCLTITTGALDIRFNPASYSTTAAEITAYGANLTGGGTLVAKAWVFGKGNDKTYDGTTAASVTSFKPDLGNTLPPVALNDATNANFNNQNVGSNKPITYNSGFTHATFALFAPSTAAAGSYTTRANITEAPLTIQANNLTKVYGSTAALSPTAFTTPVAPQNGETVGSVTLTSPGTAVTAAVVGSPYAVTPSGATGGSFNPSNYSITYLNGTLAVTPAPLTVTASNASKLYGQTPTLSAFTTSALVNGETVGSVTQTSPGIVGTAPVAGSPYVITPSAATGGTFTPTNYSISYANGVLTVLPVPLTIKANDASKPYGTVVALPVTAFTSTGLVNGDTVTSVKETSPGTVATAHVAGSPYAITPSGATGSFVASNYTIAYVNGALTVTPVPLTIKANDATKTYGTVVTLPATAFTSSGLVNGDTVASVTETSPGTVATAAVAGSPYLITPSGATGGTFTASNYTIAYVNGVLMVTPAALTIKANDTSKIYGTAVTLPVTAFTSTGLVNGDTVTSVTEVSPGTVVTAPVAGSPYAIIPSGATGSYIASNYTIAYVNGVLTVRPAPLTITANDATKPYGTVVTLPVTAFTSTGLVNGDTVTSVKETSPGTVATAHVAGSPYAITPSGATGSFVPTNYTIAYVNGKLTVTPIPLTIMANDATKPLGTTITLPTTAFVSSGLVNGDTITGVTLTSPGTSAAAPVAGNPYLITPSAATGTSIATDYTIHYVNGTLIVTPLAVVPPIIVPPVVEPPVVVPPIIEPPIVVTPVEPPVVVPPVVVTPVVEPPVVVTPVEPTVVVPPVVVVEPPVVVPPVVEPPIVVVEPPVVEPPVITTSVEPTEPHVEVPFVTPTVVPPVWPPVVTPPNLPPQLVTLVPPVVSTPVVVVERVMEEEGTPIAGFVSPQPELLVAPRRPPKQDRN